MGAAPIRSFSIFDCAKYVNIQKIENRLNLFRHIQKIENRLSLSGLPEQIGVYEFTPSKISCNFMLMWGKVRRRISASAL